MSSTVYAFVIGMCVVGVAALIFIPIIMYLVLTRGSRLSDIIAYFNTHKAVASYYRQFRRSQPADQRQPVDFEKDLIERFNWRYYLLPMGLLLSLIVALGYGSFETLCAWFGVVGSRGFVFSGIGMAAIAGAAMWVIADELARVRRRDFTTTDVYNYVFRLLLSVPFGWALAHVVLQQAWLPVAFFLGGFPTTTLFQIARRLGAKNLGLADDPETGGLELEQLQCVNKSNAERFQSEGVSTITELAYCDPVDLTLRTNFDFNYVADCVSGALLWIYFPDKMNIMCAYSLRGAQEVGSFMDTLNNSPTAETLSVLHAAAAALSVPSAALRTTLDQVAEDPYTKFLREVWC